MNTTTINLKNKNHYYFFNRHFSISVNHFYSRYKYSLYQHPQHHINLVVDNLKNTHNKSILYLYQTFTFL